MSKQLFTVRKKLCRVLLLFCFCKTGHIHSEWWSDHQTVIVQLSTVSIPVEHQMAVEFHSFGGTNFICFRSSTNRHQSLRHFSAPRKDINPKVRTKWIRNIQAHQNYSGLDAQIRICELHFDPKCISTQRHASKKQEKWLKKGSCPTIFPAPKRWANIRNWLA